MLNQKILKKTGKVFDMLHTNINEMIPWSSQHPQECYGFMTADYESDTIYV